MRAIWLHVDVVCLCELRNWGFLCACNCEGRRGTDGSCRQYLRAQGLDFDIGTISTYGPSISVTMNEIDCLLF